ncbi:MAG TPA: GvpL/GvpF family gas vesicle protein [Longimicrobiaceae bacterium]|nr:GvpL/GvpF family gas vesicle protein [Longimicrobiaceae bacterium]
MNGARNLIYLYGIVPENAPEPPSDLRGLEGGAVRLVAAGGVKGVVGEVPSAEYAEEALNSRLDDLTWIGERGLAHEAVLSWYAERGPVIPLSLFSLHTDEARLRERLESDAARTRRILAGLAGRREWGIKLWRIDETFQEHVDELSPALKALTEEMQAVQPGRQFLLRKKRDALKADEMRAASSRVARGVYEAIESKAERAAKMTIPQVGSDAGRTLVLHSAFLVPEEDYPEFQRAVSEAAQRNSGIGFEIEFTGPWPPYHFADDNGD